MLMIHNSPTSAVAYNKSMTNSNKTTATSKNPFEFIDEWVDDEQKRRDSLALIDMMQRITGHPPKT